MDKSNPAMELARVSLFSAIATFASGVLYVVGKSDTLLILPVICASVTVIMAIAAMCAALITGRGFVVLAWLGGGLLVCLLVAGLLLPPVRRVRDASPRAKSQNNLK